MNKFQNIQNSKSRKFKHFKNGNAKSTCLKRTNNIQIFLNKAFVIFFFKYTHTVYAVYNECNICIYRITICRTDKPYSFPVGKLYIIYDFYVLKCCYVQKRIRWKKKQHNSIVASVHWSLVVIVCVLAYVRTFVMHAREICVFVLKFIELDGLRQIKWENWDDRV